ncbi:MULTISPECIES: N-acetylgalactosamine-N,N'-diacetylbacillosaminyl-diphospho-undecaprenol 4-alpha-N-acetylgalactosaminyltransferase [Campylobacter]|uniref:Glycosyltransferase n=1 Tax=Campylobacter porcelli TaxID=1660073 RepID=A0A1X9SUX1_9BACT|nr:MULTISPECIES: glycosyltransferase [unclassified Campylobacter]MCR8678876.1 glycosyltransferase [Campylobacter sp. RM19072]MCR8695927.1 glycosyltransferase [Campylobacter sp. RM19073]MEE3704823.1 glycosyltransferase [Campylobacter sp. CX2-8023-23]MEE3744101.1 glycosyltransferase [Campylobacter sp. CX2-4855-23]MEE3776846.1 glycosyltransferase [Campylobacter sp. CX2-4080-23]
MKKISLFIYSMAGGGAERVVSNLLNELIKRYEVYLVLMNNTISYKIPHSVKICYLENSKPFENGFLKFAKLPFLALKYKKLCDELGTNLHFVWMNRPCYVAALARIFGDKKPLVLNECSTPSVLYASNTLKSKISKFLLRWLYPKADFIYPNSLGNLSDLSDNFGISKDKMKVLYNAIDIEDIQKKASELVEFKEEFFLSVGRLDSGKNHELLIKAYAGLKNCDKSLIILGDGVLRGKLEALIRELNLENRVFLLGFDNNPYKYMAKCYAFVFVSLFEGFSNALIEALACEKLVISSDHKSGARELIGDNQWGYLVPTGDQKATQEAMQRAIDEPDFVKYYEKNAIIRAREFDKKIVAKNLIDELEAIYANFK